MEEDNNSYQMNKSTETITRNDTYSTTNNDDDKESAFNGTNGTVQYDKSKAKHDEALAYNPYEHRNMKHATSYGETLFHMLKASLGTGILSIPYAFKNSGYFMGVVGTFLIGIFSTYCIHIMVVAQHELCRRKKIPLLSYPEIPEAMLSEGPVSLRWLAPYGRIFSFVFLILCETGAACVYIIFVASNLKAVADRYFGDQDIRFYMYIIFLPMLLLCWIRNLKLLAPFSTMATFITITSFGITIYYIFSDIPSINDRIPVGDITELPLFFGTVMFSMSAIGIIMPLENEMQKPKQFTSKFGVLHVAMLSITFIYMFFGFVGYLKYGEGIAGSITLNLPQDEVLAQSVKLMLALAIFCTISLPQYITYNIIWNCYLKQRLEKTDNVNFWIYFLKTVIFVITFACSLLVPNLELIISLVGSLCLPIMAIVLPSLAELITFWDDYKGKSKYLFILKHLFIFTVAFIGFVTGVSTSVKEIFHKVFHVEM